MDDVRYVPGINFSERLISAIQQQRVNTLNDTYKTRLAAWSAIVSQMSARMNEAQTIQKHFPNLSEDEFPDELGVSIVTYAAQLLVSFAEFFDSVSSDPDTDLKRFIEAMHEAHSQLATEELEKSLKLIHLPDMDLDTLNRAVNRYLAAEDKDSSGGYL